MNRDAKLFEQTGRPLFGHSSKRGAGNASLIGNLGYQTKASITKRVFWVTRFGC